MSSSSVPVDLLNPGQVFACLGFVEAADILLGEARGGFDWTVDGDGSARFQVEAASEDPVARVLRFIDEAKVTSWAPAGSSLDTGKKWEVGTVQAPKDSHEYPFPEPGSPATLPARLCDAAGNVIAIDHWGDRTRRDNMKFWAGSGGYPGAALARDALKLINGCAADRSDDPFALTADQSSSFRFDWRRDYVPIDAGFSPNDHRSVTMQGYPVVELLAAIGLTHARPLRHEKLRYSYGVAGIAGPLLYDPIFLRATLGARRPPLPAMPFRRFAMRLAWPGQENQARCITEVTEENAPS